MVDIWLPIIGLSTYVTIKFCNFALKYKQMNISGDNFSRFAPISLDEMSGIKLMNRIDTKFVTTVPLLLRLLKLAQDDYRMQEIDGLRNMTYGTVYFDTPALDMFIAHHNGHSGRQKVRIRTYVDSHMDFLEVKTKNNHGRTRKKRISVTDDNLREPAKVAFLNQHLRYDPDALTPRLQNRFNRITLVNRRCTERLTIDTNLQFHNLFTGRDYSLPTLAIVELKRDGLQPSPVLEMLRQLRIMPTGFSKYCIGSLLTDPTLKRNRFKERLHTLERLTGSSFHLYSQPQQQHTL